ncbi:glycoside hydrolase family 2 TIM barrel-domain containing protein [Yeosuana sp. MJ-SS3]|uniref:Glycoside hydrolase family 2 TIM barrel-domain containing protein n=1 Tax=Gilvirhabdus luticola TaxID=3079858 RepID=A0ABU3U6A5_9FLAO|nr:glycoside hydrolase family 2 TIM barrel-domain containing protein [Yeosuana sp. MJ-SS3]MDU8885660.1 glycoside hydrolase family 2 TIM barrel-domain containing protein [Yeosuana sp. MJ-SS3]
MRNNFLNLILFLFTATVLAQVSKVSVEEVNGGVKLVVNGEDFMINGMNWDYIPIGTNTVNADFWNKSDDVIKAGLDTEMSLLKNMNVNVIRQYTGVPARWIKYIYENYGIYTMLNHSFGRYGLTLDGVWTPVTVYSEPRTQEFLMNEIEQLVKDYKNTPGLLLYLLGNENNYGLFWAGAETEDFPDSEEEKKFIGESRGRPMYKLMNEAAKKMKALDSSHPVAICNGDVLFIDIIAEECKDIDIYGVNSYRGPSFTDMFQVVKQKLNKPVMFTEFGADAFNAIENKEDQFSQAYYMVENWKEIYQNAAGLGKAENSIGGFTFQFSDGWWKYGFDKRENADIHDNNASWANGGYLRDYMEGENNMNEEWFGICAKGPTNERGLYELYPRAAYYALKEAHQLNPYDEGVTLDFVNNYFDRIQIMDAVLKARGDKASLMAESNKKLRLSNLRAEFTTFNTGGSLITTPDSENPDTNEYPNKLGFDHMESYFVGVEGNPSSNMRANLNLNILGNVAENPIDEIFYENRARPVSVNTEDGPVDITTGNRVQVYNAEFEWNAKDFDLRGFYRTGHYHWGYEGDFFGLYPEANYGPNLDIYQGVISGIEIDGKKGLDGIKAAFGPQLWWGANPAVLLKYNRKIGHFDVSAIFHEDVAEQSETVTSIAIPLPKTRRATISVEREFGNFDVQLGAIWGGEPLNGREFQVAKGQSGNYIIYTDKINSEDNWGGKAKITYQNGKFNWYAQGTAQGLVANGGYDQTQTFTGWKLKDTGSGNQTNFLTGFALTLGNFQIAPNFLWQKPIVEAMPNDVQAPGRLRNIQDDPFAVRANRETTAGEILFTFDPTPGTWFYEWDNDRSEDAPLSLNLGFVYRHHPTTMDAAIGFLDDRTSFAFPNAAPAEDLWEVHSRIVSKVHPDLGIIANLYAGNGQANGSDERLITRLGGDIRLIYNKIKLVHSFKIDDWGPFDYHRDFNLTYPVQLMLDLSTTVGKPDWFILPDTKIGIRGTWRSLDKYSNRYAPTAVPPNTFPPEPILSPVGFDKGQEWEIRTYIHINIGK